MLNIISQQENKNLWENHFHENSYSIFKRTEDWVAEMVQEVEALTEQV